MNVLRVAVEVPGLFLGPLVCRLLGGHRPHVWRHHAAPQLVICTRCWHAPKETR